MTCEACDGTFLLQPECHDGRGRCDPIECPECCGPDRDSERLHSARGWICNAVNALVRAAAGVTGNMRGEVDQLNISIRIARQHLDAAEKSLRRTG